MLFEQLLRYFTDRKNCEHEWAETKVTYGSWSILTWESYFKHHLKCKKCGKKTKCLPNDVPRGVDKSRTIYY